MQSGRRPRDFLKISTFRLPWPDGSGAYRLQDITLSTFHSPGRLEGDAAQIIVDQKAVFTKYNTGNWDMIGPNGISFSGGTFDIDSNNNPYALISDRNNSGKATVLKYSGGTCQTVGNPGFSSAGYGFGSIAVSKSGMPYVFFPDPAFTYKATVMKFNGTSWNVISTPGFSTFSAVRCQIKLDTGEVPYVVYSDNVISNTKT